jgi:hypothetical protein
MSVLRNQRGQGIVEYILTLIVGVALILGGMYQLNTAFKTWATNYFGNYLACLLEAGELPSISGGGGDSGVCNQFFKPFSLAEGRPLKENAGQTGNDTANKTGSGAGANDKRAGASYVAGGGSSRYGGGSAFGHGGGNRGFAAKGGKGRGGGSSTFTGSTDASDYGGGSGSSNRRIEKKKKTLLDNRFAFDQDRENRQKKSKSISNYKKPSEEGGPAPKIRVKKTDRKRDIAAQEDTGLNIPNFLRILIIAAIVIALVFFLGGQALQIGKSMD